MDGELLTLGLTTWRAIAYIFRYKEKQTLFRYKITDAKKTWENKKNVFNK